MAQDYTFLKDLPRELIPELKTTEYKNQMTNRWDLTKEQAVSKNLSYKNNTLQNIILNITLQAGDGEIARGWQGSGWFWRNEGGANQAFNYNMIQGNRGNDLQLLHNGKLIATATGGSGNVNGTLTYQKRHERSWVDCGKRKYAHTDYGWSAPQSKYNDWNVQREGQYKVIPLVLKKGESFEIKFISNGAGSNHFKKVNTDNNVVWDLENPEEYYPINHGYARIDPILFD